MQKDCLRLKMRMIGRKMSDDSCCNENKAFAQSIKNNVTSKLNHLLPPVSHFYGIMATVYKNNIKTDVGGLRGEEKADLQKANQHNDYF